MESAVIKRLPAQHRSALRGNIHVKKVHKVYRVCTSRYIKQEKEVPSKYNPEQFLSKCTYFHSLPLPFLLLVIIIFKFCLFLSVLSHNERETVGGRLAYVKAALPTLSSCFYSSQNNKKKIIRSSRVHSSLRNFQLLQRSKGDLGLAGVLMFG